MPSQKTIDLQAHLASLVKAYGGLYPAAQELRINASYLWRLQHGKVTNPSPDVLRRMGLARVVTYVRLGAQGVHK